MILHTGIIISSNRRGAEMKNQEIITLLEQLSPRENACSWDNVGLLVGHREQEIKRVLIALDATIEVVETAVKEKVDLVITHHPMIFSPVKNINDDTPCGRKILQLVEHHIAYYAMHTNFDIKGGMADLAAQRMQLKQVAPLEVTEQTQESEIGLGCIGKAPAAMTLEQCAKQVKAQFQLADVSVYGDLHKEIHTIAMLPGSGKSVIMLAKEKGADVLITGDIGHHEGLDAVEAGIAVIDASHYGLEHIFCEFIKEYLQEKCQELDILTCDNGRPFQII